MTISELTAHDGDIRVIENLAVIHARTIYTTTGGGEERSGRCAGA